jgi:hypothetical protein
MVVRPEQFVQDQLGTLNGAISAAATSLTITSTTGWPTTGDFRIQIGGELILVTGVAGAVWTIERGIEGTGAATHADLDTVEAKLTGGALARFLRDNRPWTYDKAYRIQDVNGDTLTASDFTMVTNGSYNPVLDDAPCGGIRLTKDDQGATDNVLMAVRTAPSTPYTVTMAFTHELFGVSSQAGAHAGALFYQTTGDNIIVADLAPCFNAGQRVLSHTSKTAGSSILKHNEPFPVTMPYWMRIEDDGTNLIFYYAPTGGIFGEPFLTRLRGLSPFSVGPTEVGFAHNNFRGYVDQGRQSFTMVAYYEDN